jgi:hypothetical protein
MLRLLFEKDDENMKIRVFEKPGDVCDALGLGDDLIFVHTEYKPNEVQYIGKLTIDELLEMFDDFESCCFFTIKYGE